jgi:hypothetical protein
MQKACCRFGLHRGPCLDGASKWSHREQHGGSLVAEIPQPRSWGTNQLTTVATSS